MSKRDQPASQENQTFEEAVISYGCSDGLSTRTSPRLVSHPLLRLLKETGTSHFYADTASIHELEGVVSAGPEVIYAEVDGNTVNQPLVKKIIQQYLQAEDPRIWANGLHGLWKGPGEPKLLPLLYAIVCGRIGNDFLKAFAGGRTWEVSLQLHMGLCKDLETAKRMGRYLRSMVPSALIKVPFTPQAPHCILLARDLELEGIPVNFTSTFSARQAVVAAVLANVTRTNIFMGRLDEGLKAERLGAHVGLEAQRALVRLRRETGVKTQLIIASMRDWQSFIWTAGCDVYTVPCQVIQDLLEQEVIALDAIQNQLETSYEAQLGISGRLADKLGQDQISRLYRVEPEFVEFLVELRGTTEYRKLLDGEHLAKQFEAAGFGDFFYAPNESEWSVIRQGKIPDLEGPLSRKLSLDTLYSLHADGDFEKSQEIMDREILERIQS
jgi:transaldolase